VEKEIVNIFQSNTLLKPSQWTSNGHELQNIKQIFNPLIQKTSPKSHTNKKGRPKGSANKLHGITVIF